MSTNEDKKYRSKLEALVASILGRNWDYESERISYQVERKYTPDFISDCHGEGLHGCMEETLRDGEDGDTRSRKVYIEVKGYFRSGDTQKYKAIKARCDSEGDIFIMLLQSPKKPVRRGAKQTMGEWCERHSIEWYSLTDLKSTKAYTSGLE